MKDTVRRRYVSADFCPGGKSTSYGTLAFHGSLRGFGGGKKRFIKSKKENVMLIQSVKTLTELSNSVKQSHTRRYSTNDAEYLRTEIERREYLETSQNREILGLMPQGQKRPVSST